MPLSNIYLMKISTIGNQGERVIPDGETCFGSLTPDITMVYIKPLGMGEGLVDCAAI